VLDSLARIRSAPDDAEALRLACSPKRKKAGAAPAFAVLLPEPKPLGAIVLGCGRRYCGNSGEASGKRSEGTAG